MRIRETQYDRDNEQRIITYACLQWDCEAYKLPMNYCLDYALTRDKKIQAFAEIKKRNAKSTDYKTLMMPLRKLVTAGRYWPYGIKTFLIIESTDWLGYIEMKEPETIEIGGTYKRNDPDDIEPMCHFKIGNFKELLK